jgi:hypothetical protein
MKILLYILLLAGLVGCKAIEQAKDRKAVGRVLSKPDLTAEVGKRVAPCANDTTIITDTTIVIDQYTKYDTAYISDTVTNEVTKVVTKTKTEYRDKLRTVTKIVLDEKLQKQLIDSIDYWKAEAYKARGVAIEAQRISEKQKSRASTWMWLFIVLCGGFGVGLYFAIRKPKTK